MLEIKDLFENLDEFEHKSIFDDLENILGILPKIETYLTDFFSKNKPVIKGTIHKNAVLIGKEIYIDDGVEVQEGVTIHAPAIIGKNTVLRSGAYLRGNVIAGKKCIIGHATELKNSIMFNDSKAPHFNYVGDSVLGEDVNLGAGVILANFKSGSADETVYVHDGNKNIKTGLRKFGALVGDNVHIGCNSVLNPGTIVGKNTLVYALTSLIGVIPPDSLVKHKSNIEITRKK